MMNAVRPPPTMEELDAIREGVCAVVTRFDDDYWLARDEDGVFPHAFHKAMADGGWLGITMPEEYGGSGQGRSEEHTSELQSIQRLSYAVFCFKKKKNKTISNTT